MLSMTAGSADAAFPGDNGEIAFSKENYRNGTPGIFAVQPDGTGQDRLTSGTDYSPSYSADGQKAVFVGLSSESEMDFGQDIYVMDADGSNVQQVTATPAATSLPRPFPGRRDHSLREVQREERRRRLQDEPGLYWPHEDHRRPRLLRRFGGRLPRRREGCLLQVRQELRHLLDKRRRLRADEPDKDRSGRRVRGGLVPGRRQAGVHQLPLPREDGRGGARRTR